MLKFLSYRRELRQRKTGIFTSAKPPKPAAAPILPGNGECYKNRASFGKAMLRQQDGAAQDDRASAATTSLPSSSDPAGAWNVTKWLAPTRPLSTHHRRLLQPSEQRMLDVSRKTRFASLAYFLKPNTARVTGRAGSPRSRRQRKTLGHRLPTKQATKLAKFAMSAKNPF